MNRIFQILPWFFLLGCLLLIFFAIPRGFDFSDEGLYLLLADPRQANQGGVFGYDLFFKLFYRISGIEFGIQGLRYLRFFTYLLGAIALLIFWKNLFPNASARHIFPIALLGLFGGYAFLPAALSYNSLSVVLLCFWLALLSMGRQSLRHYLLLGLILTLLFYVKISVWVLLLPLSLMGYFRQGGLHLRLFLGILLPFVLLEGLFYVIFGECGLSRVFEDTGFLYQRADYSLGMLLRYTSAGFFWTVLSGLPFFFAGFAQRSGRKFHHLLFVLALVIAVLIFQKTMIYVEWSHSVLLLTFGFAAWLLGVGYLPKGKQVWFFWVLLLLPFVLHFGSNVYWMRLGIHYWVFWLMAIYMLIPQWSKVAQHSLGAVAALGSFVLVSFGLWVSPYESPSLWKANQVWEYRPGKEIMLSQEQVDFLVDLRKSLIEVSDGEVLALYGNPGLLSMQGLYSPYSPAFWQVEQVDLFFKSDSGLKMVWYNGRGEFPFDKDSWDEVTTLTQPDGKSLQVLWKK